jgi:glycosyltransferase involved in cell wall biosynthesis
MRIGSIEMLDEAAAAGLLRKRFDAVFTTSLLSAADVRALLPRAWHDVPLILFMHENQAAYPTQEQTAHENERDMHFALTTLTSVLAADLVIWNSEWNKHSFLDGMAEILRHAPDMALADVRQRIEERSQVVWPPVESPPDEPPKSAKKEPQKALHNTIRVVWPHRWEHDKGPEDLLALANNYAERLHLRFRILGEQFGETPRALAEFRRRFAHRIEHIGYEPDRDKYWQHLRESDWVLSTARHEFFGIAVVESMLAGCLPWLPDRLSYPELLPPPARGISPLNPPRDEEVVRKAIAAHLEDAHAERSVQRLDAAVNKAAGPVRRSTAAKSGARKTAKSGAGKTATGKRPKSAAAKKKKLPASRKPTA